MAGLFKNKIIKEKLERFDVPDFEEKLGLIKAWNDAYQNGELQKKTETQCEQAFNNDLFIKVLGYTSFPNDIYSIQPKDRVETRGGQIPDATLGYFKNNSKRVIAVVEIKDANTSLDKSQHREGNLSPIQQAFKYKPQFKECGFVIATNFFEIRLFRDNQLDFERFTLADLVDPKDDYFQFRKFYYLLSAQNFVTEQGQTETERLLSAIRIEQEKITNSFYKEYKKLREDLILDIVLNNKDIKRKDFYTHIVEKAQKIVDRIVFISFFEDSGLLPDGKLAEVVQYAQKGDLKEPVWDTLKKFFAAIDQGSERLGVPNGYNGELFKNDEELNKLKISDEVCIRFVELGKFDFEEDLSVNILGHIFEQSITDLERLKNYSDEKGIEIEKKDSKRKKDGIYYTPEYIVDYIVKNSVGKYLEDKEQEVFSKYKLDSTRIKKDETYNKRALQAYTEYLEILQNITVLDPACGSGAFLVKVFDYLLSENKRVSKILADIQGSASLYSSEDYVKQLLQNNVYGVDLNPESVEITKLSLWLKSAQRGQKLITLKENIKCGNSLIEDPSVAGARAFEWHKEFPEIMKKGGFDVVIGNPPYGADISKEEQKYFVAQFSTASYKLDTYALFIEKSLGLLNDNGYLGFIVPYTWLSIQQHKKLRELVLNYNLYQIIDLPTKIFEDADLDTVIVGIAKTSPRKDIGVGSVGLDSTIEVNNHLDTKSIKEHPDLLINLSFTPADAELVKKVQNQSSPLSSIFDVSQGYIPYRRSDLVKEYGEKGNEIVDQRLWHSDKKEGAEYKQEIQGRDLSRYYNTESNQYIKYGKHVAGYVDPKFFTSPRVLVMEVTRGDLYRISATYVEKEYYNTPSIINIIHPENNKDLLLFVLSLVNSALFSWYHRKINPKANAKTSIPKILVGDIKKLPIKLPEGASSYSHKAKRMLELQDELHHLLNKTKTLFVHELRLEKPSRKLDDIEKISFDELVSSSRNQIGLDEKDKLFEFYTKYVSEIRTLKQEIDTLNSEIDDLVFALYDLTDKERKLVTSTQ